MTEAGHITSIIRNRTMDACIGYRNSVTRPQLRRPLWSKRQGVFIGINVTRKRLPFQVRSEQGKRKRWLETQLGFPICPLIIMHRFCLLINGKEIVYHTCLSSVPFLHSRTVPYPLLGNCATHRWAVSPPQFQ